MLRNKTAKQHEFATVPRADIPRSKFSIRQTRKQAFNASELIPIMIEEVLPGDVWQHTEAVLARLATPIAPIMDDMDLETFYFYVPNRISWPTWEDFITGVNTAATIPQIEPVYSPGIYGVKAQGMLDQMGIMPQVYTSSAFSINVLPVWAYFEIWNEWFRDQNLQEKWVWTPTWTYQLSDAIGLEVTTSTRWDQQCLRVNKRHDYFTSSLPWAQKGNPVTIGLVGAATIKTNASDLVTGTHPGARWLSTAGIAPTQNRALAFGGTNLIGTSSTTVSAPADGYYPSNLYADLSTATATTINALRLAFQTQKLLERDARGGSRYIEQLLSHFGVRAPDFRLQRPEYLGGSKIPITINPVAQTADYTADPAASQSALGNLGAEMHAAGSKKTFTYSAVEHGYIIGLAVVRATPTYQQGTRRHWRRSGRLDYYFPAFAMLGEQAVATQEIFQNSTNTPAVPTWGYQEHWAEMRYTPNEITGVLRSTAAQPLDWWHLSEKFSGEPALNGSFITDKTQETLARALATAPDAQWSAQIIMDVLHQSNVARLMPTYSVPGLIDHF